MGLLLDNCEGILLSLDSHKSVPAPFLTKTYQLVDDPTTDHIVSWGEDHTTFVVWRPPEFARDLLPNYFKHNNFSSFVRQLNTYGFRKIVPDRWEFANELFKKGEKHLLCEIHRRKTAHPQHQPQLPLLPGLNCSSVVPPSFFPFSTSSAMSPSTDSDDVQPPNWCDETSVCSVITGCGPNKYNNVTANANANSVSALSEDNQRLRRSNNMLMSELAHMKKLYNDIIYFVQNHVKPVPPPTSTSSYASLLHHLPSNNHSSTTTTASIVQRPMHMNHLLSYYNNNPTSNTTPQLPQTNHNTTSKTSSVTLVEEVSTNRCNNNNTKLFGVSLQSKKRLHPDSHSSDIHKTRLVLEKDDLGLNLMPPSAY
ncbi:heat stress transcription factor B-4 [Senna tora]|uniref:Heat stress transcription factor B-4 n=1 Tax=Senna tora TaxID=362788 RepID=A0A834WSN6_9FABA|nr:heat stress transcription factor B-4 [Senna tora]